MQGEFPALAEGFGASVNTAHEGLLICMRILMFAEVLREREHFTAVLTRKGLPSTVNVVVPLQRKLGCEALATGWELTLKDSLDKQALDMFIIL
jgi:hypothetical protein